LQRSRDLVWDGLLNVRDLGGLPTEDGLETRFGVVVRADNATLLSKTGRQALIEYGVRRIVDLRHDEEVQQDPAHPEGVEIVRAPIVAKSSMFADIDELLVGVSDPVAWRSRHYLALLDRAAPNFVRAVTAVAQVDEGVVLVHCSGGVDRTGLVSALLLRLAGVGIETVAAEWAESQANWAPTVGEWIDSAPDEGERGKRQLLSVMPAPAMHSVLVELDRAHGSAQDYLVGAGADERDLDRVRDRLRSDAA
jgi:protein-tyrosine phosphatase